MASSRFAFWTRCALAAAAASALVLLGVPTTSALPLAQTARGHTARIQTPTPPAPDTPPLPHEMWKVHVTASRAGLSPSEIVLEPRQRVEITFENREGAPANLAFRLPGAVQTLDHPLPAGQISVLTVTAPNQTGRYAYAVTGLSGRHAPTGEVIVAPDVDGAVAPRYGARDVRIVARDFSFNPTSPIFAPGEHVRLTLLNAGQQPHNIVFAFPGHEVTFPADVGPGEMRTMTFTVPARNATYAFYDPLQGDRDKGMQGTLIVQRPATVIHAARTTTNRGGRR